MKQSEIGPHQKEVEQPEKSTESKDWGSVEDLRLYEAYEKVEMKNQDQNSNDWGDVVDLTRYETYEDREPLKNRFRSANLAVQHLGTTVGEGSAGVVNYDQNMPVHQESDNSELNTLRLTLSQAPDSQSQTF